MDILEQCAIGSTWSGFLNPFYKECPDCSGIGSTRSDQALETLIRLILMAGENSLERPAGFSGRGEVLLPNYPGAPPNHCHRWPHPCLREAGVSDPGDTMHEVTTALVGSLPSGPFGYCSSDTWKAKQKIFEALGLPEKWGWCKSCNGDGIASDAREAYEAWEATPPPEGDAYQIWQTVSEGGPVSPPFATPEKLADWMVANDTSITSDMTRDDWLRFIRGPGWAPSMVAGAGSLTSGAKAVVDAAP